MQEQFPRGERGVPKFVVFGVVEGDGFAVPKSRENIGRLFHAVENGKRSRVRLRRALTRDEASLQVLGVKSREFVEGDFAHIIIQIHVVCFGHNHQFLGVGSHLINIFGIIT